MPRDIFESVQGTLEFLILKALTGQRLHGYAISRWIFDKSREQFELEEGTLYPALHRMEEKGWLHASWGVSENNRRAKFYELTRQGEREFARRRAGWAEFTDAVDTVLKARPDAGR